MSQHRYTARALVSLPYYGIVKGQLRAVCSSSETFVRVRVTRANTTKWILFRNSDFEELIINE